LGFKGLASGIGGSPGTACLMVNLNTVGGALIAAPPVMAGIYRAFQI